jgi:hypothetical protein
MSFKELAEKDIDPETSIFSLSCFVRSELFEIFSVSTTIGSILRVWAEVDAKGRADQDSFAFTFLDNMFCTQFVVEWALRIKVLGEAYTQSSLFALDLYNVFIPGIFATWIMNPLIATAAVDRPTAAFWHHIHIILQLPRFLRIWEPVNRWQKLPVFHSVFQILRGSLLSVAPFVAGMFLLAMFTLMFAIGLTQVVSRGSAEGMEPEQAATFIEARDTSFTSLVPTMKTLLRMMFHDDSHNTLYSISIGHYHHALLLFFFICFTNFVVLNLVTASVLQRSIATSRADQQESVKEQARRRDEELDQFTQLWTDVDQDESGMIESDEFENCLKDDDIVMRFESLGFTKVEMKELFTSLDVDHHRELTIEDLCAGIKEFHRIAASKHLLVLSRGSEFLVKQINKLDDTLEHSLINGAAVEKTESTDELEKALFRIKEKMNDRFKESEQRVASLSDRCAHVLNGLDSFKLKKLNHWVETHPEPPEMTRSITRTKTVMDGLLSGFSGTKPSAPLE